MTRQTRKGVFYALLTIFFILGIAVVFYAEGWRIDLTTFRAETVGGIFVRSFPSDANITLDGKHVENQSGILSQGTLITNLLPKTYEVALSAPGFDDWHENVTVAPSRVTQLQYSILVPKTGIIAASTSDIDNFFESNGQAVLQTATGTLLYRDKIIGKGNVVSHADLASMITQAGDGRYHLYDFTKSTTTNLSAILTKSGVNTNAIQEIVVDPHDPGTIFTETLTRIWRIDPGSDMAIPLQITSASKKTLSKTLVPGIAISPRFLAWTEAYGAGISHLALYDRASDSLLEAPTGTFQTITSLAWVKDGLLGILQSNGSLYSYDVNERKINKIADDVKSFYASDDGNVLAALEHHSIEIFSLAGNGYSRFNLPDIEEVRSLSWHKDDNHLFVIYPNRVSFLDLVDAGLQNFTTISSIKPDGVTQYDSQANALFVINPEGNLLRFDFAN